MADNSGRDFARLNQICPVSRETFALITRYTELLLSWQKRINLISPTTTSSVWERHILDSVQLFALARQKARWVDLGSGGGLPGLVVACFLKAMPGGHVDLVESNAKKAAFLRFVAGELQLPAEIHAERIEQAVSWLGPCEVVTARALAPLPVLLDYSNLLLKRGAVGLFPKGRAFDSELTEARKDWHFCCRQHPSVTDPDARILEITLTEAT